MRGSVVRLYQELACLFRPARLPLDFGLIHEQAGNHPGAFGSRARCTFEYGPRVCGAAESQKCLSLQKCQGRTEFGIVRAPATLNSFVRSCQGVGKLTSAPRLFCCTVNVVRRRLEGMTTAIQHEEVTNQRCA